MSGFLCLQMNFNDHIKIAKCTNYVAPKMLQKSPRFMTAQYIKTLLSCFKNAPFLSGGKTSCLKNDITPEICCRKHTASALPKSQRKYKKTTQCQRLHIKFQVGGKRESKTKCKNIFPEKGATRFEHCPQNPGTFFHISLHENETTLR